MVVGKIRLKRVIRSVVRARGFDLVPFHSSFHDYQARCLAEVTCVIDVGANVGQYADLVRQLGYPGRIVSFEPSAAAYATLVARSRSDRQWETRKTALGAAPGSATLRISANSVSSSLLEVADLHVGASPASRTVSHEDVPVATLADASSDFPAGDWWLKIDTQGYELEVLRGAGSALSRVRYCQLELSLDNLYAGQPGWLEACDFMTDAGFRLTQVEPGFADPDSGRLLQLDGLFERI